jgi:dTDP-glucose 4,6-dehydratase
VARLLVTGGAGFIGANFVHYWLQEHPGQRLVVLDAFTYAGSVRSLESLAHRTELRIVRGDIRDEELVKSLLRTERLDTIVHFAAESDVDRSIRRPDAFVEANVIGTHSMLKAARVVWLEERQVEHHRFHHVSTDEVYGSLGAHDPPFDEHSPYAPNSPYSASKAASDHLVRAYRATYGLDATISSCSNNYGPLQFPEKFIPLMIVNLLHARALPIYGDGRNVRDWLHVSDHCRAIDLILSRGRSGEVYNIGGGEECENIELARALCAIADAMFREQPHLGPRYPHCPAAQGGSTAALISFVRDRPGHDRRYAINCAKSERELGYRARIALRGGLRDTLKWYLENEPWWHAVVDADIAPSDDAQKSTVVV